MKVIGYTRMSKRAEAGSLGLAAQRRLIKADAERKDWEILWIENNGFTGSHLKRPGLQAALEALRKKEASGLVVVKMSRLRRSGFHFGQLLETARNEGWFIRCLDRDVDMTTSTGRLVAAIIAQVYQFEREQIAERTSKALQELKATGVQLGHPSTILADVVRRIRRLRRSGYTQQAISDRLIRTAYRPAAAGAGTKPQ